MSPARILIEEQTNPLTQAKRLVTRHGPVSHLRPHHGTLHGVGPVILLHDTQRRDIEEINANGTPWPHDGTHSTIRGNTLTIAANNGEWTWQLYPAIWPTQTDDMGWWIGVQQ